MSLSTDSRNSPLSIFVPSYKLLRIFHFFPAHSKKKKGSEQFFIVFVQFARNTLNVSCQIILFIHPMNLSTLQLFCFLCESVNFFFRLVNVIIVLYQQCDQVFQCFHSFAASSCRRLCTIRYKTHDHTESRNISFL